jgi:hypothetical protein
LAISAILAIQVRVIRLRIGNLATTWKDVEEVWGLI